MAGGRKCLEQRRGYGSTQNRTHLDQRKAMEANKEDEYDDNDAEDDAGDDDQDDADHDDDNDDDDVV